MLIKVPKYFNFPGYTNSSKEFLESHHYSLHTDCYVVNVHQEQCSENFQNQSHYDTIVHKFYALKMPQSTLPCCFESRICVYKILKSSLPSRHNDNIRLCLALTKWSKTLSRSPLWFSLSLSLPCVYMHHQHHVK